MFSQNWEVKTSVYQRLPPWLVARKDFLVQPVEHWKTASWKINISEHDIINTQITTEKCFFLCLS